MTKHPLSGIYAASITPLNSDSSIELDKIPEYLEFLMKRGCHGALLLGTTGEGPSFSVEERLEIFRAAIKIREIFPAFRLLAGTGTPSLEETALLTKSAFDLGFEGAVVLPPYYFHQATDDGIFTWFQQLIQRAVPKDGYLLGYHIPAQSGVPIPLSVVTKLREVYPNRFAGFKDSTKDADYTFEVGKILDKEILALTGNDIHLSQVLNLGGSGCITALSNLHSPILRNIWDAHQNGEETNVFQASVNKKSEILSRYQPSAPTIKVLISELHGLPPWGVRLPLMPLPKEKIDQLLQEITSDDGWV
jgi:4-hydroxy-tetrahydrodipicolinate synthase